MRYKDYTESYTKLHKAPNIYPGPMRDRAVLELKGEFNGEWEMRVAEYVCKKAII